MNTMQSDQSSYSIDYLNQIAPKEKRSFKNDKMFFGIIGGGLLLALIVGAMALSKAGSGPTVTIQLENLTAQLITLQKIATKANTTIQSDTLQSINANLAIQLTNANQAIGVPLKNNNVNAAAIPASITAANADTDLVSKLTDAQLNAVFDRVYSTNMAYEVDAVLIQMRSIEKQTTSKSLKSFIDSTTSNLQPIETQLQNFANQSS